MLVIVVFVLGAGGYVVVSGRAGTSEAGYACNIGSPPSMHLARVPSIKANKLLSGPEIIGCGRSSRGPLEIIGYATSSSGICFAVDLPRQGLSQGVDCKPAEESWKSRCPGLCVVSVTGVDLNANGRFGASLVSGEAAARSATVQVGAGSGDGRDLSVVIAHVDGGLLQSLRQTEPIVVFAALASGCVSPWSVRGTARGEDGSIVGEGRPKLSLPHPCHPGLPGVN